MKIKNKMYSSAGPIWNLGDIEVIMIVIINIYVDGNVNTDLGHLSVGDWLFFLPGKPA